MTTKTEPRRRRKPLIEQRVPVVAILSLGKPLPGVLRFARRMGLAPTIMALDGYEGRELSTCSMLDEAYSVGHALGWSKATLWVSEPSCSEDALRISAATPELINALVRGYVGGFTVSATGAPRVGAAPSIDRLRAYNVVVLPDTEWLNYWLSDPPSLETP